MSSEEVSVESTKRPSWLLPVIALFILWSLAFIYRTTFLIGDVRYTCLFDDAMISMTYARNLVEGFGLNWARWGEPVEGFTHPLWLALMIIPNALGIPLHLRSVCVQGLSLAFLVANLWALEAFMRRHWPDLRMASFIAVVGTAAYYPLNHWALQGMETGLQTLLLILGLGYAVDESPGSLWKLALVGAAATLLRIDMWIPVLILILAAWPAIKAATWGQRLTALAIVLLPNLAYSVFRWEYFHDVLPNTYYLKMTGTVPGVRLMRGIHVFGDFANSIWVLLFGAMFAAAALWNAHPLARWLTLLIGLQFEYAVWVGGDAWEWSSVGANRFNAVVMPLVFVLLAVGLERFVECSKRRVFAGLFTLLVVFMSNGLLSEGWKAHFDNVTHCRPPLHVPDHWAVLREVLDLNGMVPRETRVVAVWAGITGFFSHFRLIDAHGYNDRVLAKMPDALKPGILESSKFRPGHMKFDYDYTLGKLAPDVVFQTAGWRDEKEAAAIRAHGFRKIGRYWFRQGFGPDSRFIHTTCE